MAGEDRHAREWDELAKIDYFLEHLARAVERGEVDRASYDALAPRYLERRAELASMIAGRVPVPAPAPATPAAPAAVTPLPVASAPATTTPPAAAVARVVRPASKPVPWTTILTFTGAFLVIVASAIFAVATWDQFGVTFRLAFLGVLTAGFYGAAHLVRTRLKLAGGSVALTVVGSAMLLFDGWIAIDGYGWTGVWPWVGWLAVCSAVYWYTETSLGGGFFGLTGAAAQVAWVWLLADGLGWTAPTRAAAVTVIALLWAVAARRAKGRRPFASLAAMLVVAAPLTVLLSVFVLFVRIVDISPGWAELAAALVAGIAATATMQVSGLPAGLGAAGHLPVFFAIASSGGGHDVAYAVILFVLALLYASYELYRGGWGHGVLGLLAELGGWLALAQRFDWARDVTLAVVVLLACSWSVAAYLLAARSKDLARVRGAVSLRRIAFVGGWVLLSAGTLLMPAAREVIPLAGFDIAGRDAALAVLVCFAWVALARLHRAPLAVPSAYLTSLYAAAALMAWLAPAWRSAWYAIGLLVVVAGWLVGRGAIERATRLPASATAWTARAATMPILALGLLSSAFYSEAVTWQAAVLLAAASAWWLLDALTAEEHRVGLAVSSGLAVFAVGMGAAAWFPDSPGLFGWSGALCGVVFAGLGAVLRSRDGWGTAWIWGAATAGSAVAVGALDVPGPLAVALALAAAGWLVAAWVGRMPGLATLGGGLAVGALLAAAAWLDRGPWATFVLLAVPSFALLAPISLASRRRRSTGSTGWSDVGLITGLLGVLALVIVPALAHDAAGAVPGWIHLEGHVLAASLIALGAYVMVAASVRDVEPGAYLGMAFVLIAVLVERATLDVGTAEWTSTPIALYAAWVGHHWSRTHRTHVPLGTDVATVIVGLGVPAMLAANPYPGGDPWTHLAWAVGLSLLAIGLGVGLRVRAYFLGGVATIVLTAVVRSWIYLVSFWWLVLGLIGVTMLVVALTWEHQRTLYASTRSRVADALSDWR